ncbi:MAG: cbb3-type cytochrome c oxidase N-terminal domain-containing protein [Taibaiella sp.]
MMRYILTGMAILLLCIIMVMANAVASAGKIYWEREKKKNISNKIAPFLVLMFLTGITSHAQEAQAAVTPPAPGIPHDIYIFFILVALEFVVIMVLSGMLLKFLKVEKEVSIAKPAKAIVLKNIFQKMNQTVAIEEEHSLDLNHDYDGIRELDNKVPAWWRYAFYASILFGGIYMYRMFVTDTLPNQIQELDQANYIAAIQKAEYLKHAANNVDENTVAMLDASGIAEGSALFTKNCLACHGDKGQGGVGPNLTDEYWLHNGGIKDVFHSIKYGWPEKGMKAWKDDFSPVQIAQLASYIKSIQGTNPPGGKEPQGTVFTETTTTAKTQPQQTKL